MLRFCRRIVRDYVFRSRQVLKNANRTNKTKYFINENLAMFRSKLFAAARHAVKDDNLASVWTSNVSIYIKVTAAGRPVLIQTLNELHRYL